MTPDLSKRGKYILCTGFSFATLGTVQATPMLIALGGIILFALLATLIHFYSVAIFLRRQKVELTWWVPPADLPGGTLVVERPFHLHIALRNHSNQTLRLNHLHIVAHSTLEIPDDIRVLLKADTQVEITAEIRPHSAGYRVLHGAILFFEDRFALFTIRAFFPNSAALKVFPRQYSGRALSAIRPNVLRERIGLHTVKRRGVAGDLRELRDHFPGDPFKLIAWKASARKRKLIVRDLATSTALHSPAKSRHSASVQTPSMKTIMQRPGNS